MFKNSILVIIASALFSLPVAVEYAANTSKASEPYHSCLHDHFLAHMKLDTTSAEFFPALPDHLYPAYFEKYPAFASDGFDFPVGYPNASGYYKALNFGDKNHLGEDWNGNGGGNTDLGDAVKVAANGLVIDAKEVCCGWGNVVRIVHQVPGDSKRPFVETVYAHLHNIQVQPGELIKRGTQIGTIGNAKGRYSAHLHLEMRDFVGMSLGPGYSEDRFGYLNPTKYIKGNRP